MVTRLRSKLTYPYVVSTLALFLALTGGAAALQGKNTVDSGDIKKNAVRSADISNSKGVKSADVVNNALNGNDINEASLGQVPSAANADNATNAQNAQNADNADNATNANNANNADRVNGTFVNGIRYRSNATATVTTLFAGGGLILRAGCAGGVLSLTADSTVDDASIASYSVGGDLTNNAVADSNFDNADGEMDLIPDAVGDEVLSMEFSRPSSGPIVSSTQSSAHSVSLLVDDTPTGVACLVTGHLLRTGGTSLLAEIPPIISP